MLNEGNLDSSSEVDKYLEDTCMSWKTDSDNLDDTELLHSILIDVFPKYSSDDLFKKASEWTGYRK